VNVLEENYYMWDYGSMWEYCIPLVAHSNTKHCVFCLDVSISIKGNFLFSTKSNLMFTFMHVLDEILLDTS